MIKTNTEKITVDDDGSVSTISDLDVKEITRRMLHRQESTGYCPHKLETDRSVSPTFDSHIHLNSYPFIADPSPSSIKIPKLRRERQSDYGMFDKHFEDDVINWFQYIDKKKKLEIIHSLVDMIYYDKHCSLRPTYYADNHIPRTRDNDIRLGASIPNLEQDNDQNLSIKIDDIEDLSQNDSFTL